tara:strand:+ start:606 stop:1094 length:489 start_codon:yes stop_codon:yes gene_type:complete
MEAFVELVASAVHVLIDQTSTGGVSLFFRPIFDAAQFVWDVVHVRVRLHDVRAFLRHVVHTLDMDEKELLLMLVLLEQVMRSQKMTRLPRGCCRALVLCCSVLAIKHANDTREVLTDGLEHILIALRPLWRLEKRVLGLLDWQVPMHSDVYELYTTALHADP